MHPRVFLATAILSVAAIAAGCKGSTEPNTPERKGPAIVYSAERGGDTSFHLFLIDADGTSNAELQTAPGDKRYPAWAPNGDSFVFWLANPYVGLYVANPDGMNATLVPVQNFGDPRWSPDGQWIAFAADNAMGAVLIEAVHPDGSGRHTVAPGVDSIWLSPPSWSSTGRIAFMRSVGRSPGDGTIWAANVDGSGLVQLTTGRRDDRPHWSPDGSMLAYTAAGPLPGTSPIYVYQASVVKADGTGQRVLTAWDGTDSFVDDWSPDGKWVLIRRGSVGCAYYKVPVAGGAPIRISPPGDFAYCAGASWR